MRLKWIILLLSLVIIIVLFILLAITNSIQKEEKINNNLDDLYCRQLHLGMTIDEAREVLENYGRFNEYTYINEGFTRVMIVFIDGGANEKIGYNKVILNFDNEIGYTGPELYYGGDHKKVCKNGVSSE